MDRRYENCSYEESLRQKSLRRHRNRLCKIKSTIDQSEPLAVQMSRKLHHNNPKKKSMEKQRQKDIDRENSKLVTEVTRILTRPISTEKVKSKLEKDTLNQLNTRQHQKREHHKKEQHQSNVKMMRKLTAQSSTFEEGRKRSSMRIEHGTYGKRASSRQEKIDNRRCSKALSEDPTLMILEQSESPLELHGEVDHPVNRRRRTSRKSCSSESLPQRTLSVFWQQLTLLDQNETLTVNVPKPPTKRISQRKSNQGHRKIRGPIQEMKWQQKTGISNNNTCGGNGSAGESLQLPPRYRRCILKSVAPHKAKGIVDIPVIDAVPIGLDEGFERVTWRSDLHNCRSILPDGRSVIAVIGHFETEVDIELREGNKDIGQANKVVISCSRHGGNTQFPDIEALPSELKGLFGIVELELNTEKFEIVSHLIAKFLWFHVTKVVTPQVVERESRRLHAREKFSATTHEGMSQPKKSEYTTKLMLFPPNHMTSMAHELESRQNVNTPVNRLIETLAQEYLSHDQDDEDLQLAATRLQSVTRAHNTRKTIQSMTISAIRIQCMFRNMRARRLLLNTKLLKKAAAEQLIRDQKNAATMFQAVWRGCASRSKASVCLLEKTLTFPCGTVAKVEFYGRGLHLLIKGTCPDTSKVTETVFPSSAINDMRKDFDLMGSESRHILSGEELIPYAENIAGTLQWRHGHCSTLPLIYSTLSTPLDETWETVQEFQTHALGTEAPLLVVLHHVKETHRHHPGMGSVKLRNTTYFVFELFDPTNGELVWYQVSNLIDLRSLSDTLLPLEDMHRDIHAKILTHIG